jgi:large subunit ribosomal protein L24
MTQKQVKHYRISIRKGDTVRVMAGRDVGKTGRVLSVNPRKNTLIVEHMQVIKRHTRPNPAKNIKGGIVEREGPINVSNVLIVCSSCNKHARIGNNVLPDGTKARVCKRCGTTLDK